MRLRDALAKITTAELRAIAEHHGLKLSSPPMRYEMLDALLRYLNNRDNINSILKRLTVEQRSALDRLISEGGRMPRNVWEHDYGALRFGDMIGLRLPGGNVQMRSPSEALVTEGMIYDGIDANGMPSHEILIPDEIMALVPLVHKQSFADILVASPDPRFVTARGDAIRDIGILLCYVQRETVRTVRVDRLAKRDVVRLNQEMSLTQDVSAARTEEDAHWIAFIHHLAQILSLVAVQGGIMSPSDKAEEWLRETRERQTWELWTHFAKDGLWNEIGHAITASYLYSQPGENYVVAIRSALLDAIKRCPAGRWLTMASFEQAIRTHDPQFMRSAGVGKSWSSWTMSYFYGGWADVEAPLIRHALTRSLQWLGVVETGSALPQVAPTDFRLTDMGALLLKLRKGSIAQPERASIIVQPNFEIVAPNEVSPADLFHLQQVADIAKRDRASIYVLSQSAIWRNLQAGGKIDQIIAFLEKVAQRPLPQNVAYSLREWAGKHGEVTLDQVTLLTATSAALMAEVRANKKIAVTVQEAISERAVTLTTSDTNALVEQLRKAGYWPKLGEGIVGHQVAGNAGHSSVSIATSDLAHLLVAAIVAQHLAETTGWRAPVANSLIRNLTWNLTPAVVKQVQRMASEAISSFETLFGAEDEKTTDSEEQS